MRFAALFGPGVSPAFPVLEPKAEDSTSCPGPSLKRPGNGQLANYSRVQRSTRPTEPCVLGSKALPIR